MNAIAARWRGFRADSCVRHTVRTWSMLALPAVVVALVMPVPGNLTTFFLVRQDSWLLLAGTLLLAACVLLPGERGKPLSGDWRLALGIGAGMAAVAFAGHFWVLSGYDMSRDEQMASFDAAVFAQGRLLAPLPAFWRDHSLALNTLFMYPAEHRGGWISTYLPLNAAIRAGLGQIGSPWLAGPLMTLIGALALWGCARKIWSGDRDAPVIALLLYLTSAQVLVSGMTSYAMPAHLALDLVWLWLFLRRRWWADLAAVAVAFVAVGLHQPLMHPMFAAPLLLLVVIERDWSRAALYFVAYAAIGAFWLWWPNEMWSFVQADPHTPKPAGVDYFTRFIAKVTKDGPSGMAYMVGNLLRFVAWQPLLLLPLLGFAIPAIRRDRLAAALAAGCALTVAVMAVILPYQGHGFGYRYLHGLLGNVFLLAVFGWKEIASPEKARWRRLLVRTSVAGLAILLPLQLAMAHAFYRPSALVSQRIDRVDADFVVIGQGDVPFGQDLVFNPPMLDRRPIRLVREGIDPGLVTALCAGHPHVALAEDSVLAPVADYFGTAGESSQANAVIADAMRRAGCRVSLLGGVR